MVWTFPDGREAEAIRFAKSLGPGMLVFRADYVDRWGRATGKYFYIVGPRPEASRLVEGRPLTLIYGR